MQLPADHSTTFQRLAIPISSGLYITTSSTSRAITTTANEQADSKWYSQSKSNCDTDEMLRRSAEDSAEPAEWLFCGGDVVGDCQRCRDTERQACDDQSSALRHFSFAWEIAALQRKAGCQGKPARAASRWSVAPRRDPPSQQGSLRHQRSSVLRSCAKNLCLHAIQTTCPAARLWHMCHPPQSMRLACSAVSMGTKSRETIYGASVGS